MTNPDQTTDKYAELITNAWGCEGRLKHRHTNAPIDNTYAYQKAVAEPDGSMGCGYDAELDSRSAACIRDLLAALAEMQGVVERLREALETIGNGDVDYKNGQYEAQSLANELYAIRAFADAALHPTTKGDEDE